MEYPITAPAIGEAVETVKIVRYFKAVGDKVHIDEPLMELETDKAAMDVESAVSGIVKELPFPAGCQVPVGKVIAIIQAEDQLPEPPIDGSALPVNIRYVPAKNAQNLKSLLAGFRNADLSPREKQFCLDKKVIPYELFKRSNKQDDNSAKDKSTAINDHYLDISLSDAQLRLAEAFTKSRQHVVQANIQSLADNISIEKYRKELRRDGLKELVPSRLEIITWSVICALRTHPSFRARMINSSTVRQFKNPNIGIAVALDDDNLTTAVLPMVFSLSFKEMVKCFRECIREAKEEDYIPTYHCLVISDLSSYGVINAIPIVAHPATATLYVGRPYLKEGAKHLFCLSLSFNHHFINGAGAALFMKDIARNLETRAAS